MAIANGIQNGHSTHTQGQLICPVSLRPTNKMPNRDVPEGMVVVAVVELLIA